MDLNHKEYIIWGVPPQQTDETILISGAFKLPSLQAAEAACKDLENIHGCTDVRIQVIDLSKPYTLVDSEAAIIDKVLKWIEKQIGLKLELCDYFTGLRAGTCFNVMLKDKALEYAKLERLTRYKLIKDVQIAGVKRVAIFINLSEVCKL